MKGKIIQSLQLWLSVFFIQLGIWLLRKFGEVSFDQFVFHLDMSVEGLTHGDPKLTSSFIRNCLLVPTVIVGLFIFGLKHSLRYLPRKTRYFSSLLLISFIFLLHKIGFFVTVNSYYYYAKTGEDYFATHYIEPKQTVISPVTKPKNLVLIYVESLEDTYEKTDLFSRNLISSIQINAVENSYHFSQFKQAPGTGWTIAGIVSTQCGLPLRTFLKNNQHDDTTGFLNNAICLGDILKANGYNNIFINNADLMFAGKGKYLSQHGYSENYKRTEWYKKNKTDKEMNDWGLYDDLLFQEAEQKLDELESHPDKPFNLTLLTVDTHPPKGFLSHHCATKHSVTENNFEGIVECTALQVKDFIQHIQNKGYLKNTAVVIFGDHLGMKNPVYKKLESTKERYIFNLFITEETLHLNRQDMNEFDMFPSILDVLRFKIEDGKLGLGYSGFREGKVKPPFERHFEMQEKLLGYSPGYAQLWQNTHNTN